jgi:hypothetical protein
MIRKPILRKFMLAGLSLMACASALYLIAADHIDSPAVTGNGSDITDFYAFQSPESPDNLVFVVNVQGLLSPSASASATFDEEVMVEINIDNSGTKDNIEDLVIQATFENGKVRVYGPVAPTMKGLNSELAGMVTAEANISTYGGGVNSGAGNGVKVFAGPRDDPFFFDLGAFQEIIAGMATSFDNPGTDTFAGTNVLSLVIEVPKSSLGSSASINTWATSNRKM